MKKRIIIYIVIAILAIIISIPLLREDFDIYRDDGLQHVARLMGTYQSITEGQNFPVIMSNFCNSFGYSWNLFYSPVTTYVPLLLHFLTHSFILDLKCFMILVTFLSGIAMYEFVYKVTKNRCTSLLSAILYILAPYRLTDMYLRIAVAELASFVFLPMVFQGAYTLFSDAEEDKKKIGGLLIIGATGLILTHLVIALYTAIIGFFYVLIHIKKLKDTAILKKLIIIVLGTLCVTSFFWAPMLEHKDKVQYEVFKQGRMERTDVLIQKKLEGIDLIYTQKGKLSFEIGLVTLIGLVLTILVFDKVEQRYRKIYAFSLITGAISILMTLKCFPFEKLPEILKMLQFSFRMLEFEIFFLSFAVAVNYTIIIKRFNMKDVCILTLIAFLLIIPLTKCLTYTEKRIDEKNIWPAVRVTSKTGRVHAGCATFEYLPSKAFDHLEYIKLRENKVYILKGEAQIQDEYKNGTNMSFQLNQAQSGTILELPYIYYLGYSITLENEKGKTILEPYESENGFVAIHLNGTEKGRINVTYTGTNIMKGGMVVSILSLSGMVLYMYVCKRTKMNIDKSESN